MRRGRGLRTNREKQRAWQDRSRGTIEGERDQAATERAVREAVFKRDGYRCLLAVAVTLPGPCHGRLTVHHRRKAGAAGAYTEANLVSLCAHHNGMVEDEPDYFADVSVPTPSGMVALVVREGDPEWDQLGKRAARYG